MEERLLRVIDRISFGATRVDYKDGFSPFIDDVCRDLDGFECRDRNTAHVMCAAEHVVPLLRGDGLFVDRPSTFSRVTVCGDLHGDMASLIAFLERCDLADPRELIVFLGDYIDRGPHSIQVLLFVLMLKAAMPDRVVTLRGNHEGTDCAIDGTLMYNLNCRVLNGKYDIYGRLFALLPLVCCVGDRLLFVHACVPEVGGLRELRGMLSRPGERLVGFLTWGDLRLGDNGDEYDKLCGVLKRDLQPHSRMTIPLAVLFGAMKRLGVSLLVRGHSWVGKGFHAIMCGSARASNSYVPKRSISIAPSAARPFVVSLHTHENEDGSCPAMMAIDTALGEYRVFQIGRHASMGDIRYPSQLYDGTRCSDDDEEEEEEEDGRCDDEEDTQCDTQWCGEE